MLDALEALKKDGAKVLSLSAMEDLGRSVNLPSEGLDLTEEVTFILHYFTELGLLSWFPDPALRDTIILVSFLDHSRLQCA